MKSNVLESAVVAVLRCCTEFLVGSPGTECWSIAFLHLRRTEITLPTIRWAGGVAHSSKGVSDEILYFAIH